MVQSAAFTTSAFSSAVRQGFKSPSLRPSGLGSSPIPVHKASRHVEVPLVHTASSRFSAKPDTERRRLAPSSSALLAREDSRHKDSRHVEVPLVPTASSRFSAKSHTEKCRPMPSSPVLPAKNGQLHKDSRHVEVPLVPTASSSVPAKPNTEKRRKTPSSSVLPAKKAQESSSDGSSESRSHVTLRLGPTSSQSCIKKEMPFKLWNGTAHERDFARHFVRSLTKDKAKAEKFIRKHLSEPAPSADAQPRGGDSSIVPNVVLPDVPDRSFSDCSGWESSSMANIAEPEEGTRLPLDDSPPAWMRIKRSNRVRRLSCDTPPPTLDAVCSPGTTVDHDVFVDESSLGHASCTESWDHLPEVQWVWSRQRAEMYAVDEERRRSNHHWFAQAPSEEGTTTSTVSGVTASDWDRLPEVTSAWSTIRAEVYAECEDAKRQPAIRLAQDDDDGWDLLPEVTSVWSTARAEAWAEREDARRQAFIRQSQADDISSGWDFLPEIEWLWSRQRVEMYAKHEEIRRSNHLWLAQNQLDASSTVTSEEDNSSLIWATYPGGRPVVGSEDDTLASVNSLSRDQLETSSPVASNEDNSSLIWATRPGGKPVVESPVKPPAQAITPAAEERPSAEQCLERLKSWMKEKHGNDIFDRVVEREQAMIVPPVPGLQRSTLGPFQSFCQQPVVAQVPAPTPSPSGWSWKSISCLAATAVTVGVAIGVTACRWFS